MVIPALLLGEYAARRNVNVGQRPSGKRHIVDVVAKTNDGASYLISLKWQQVAGTAEEKIPYEVLCLAHALRTGRDDFKSAYLVLGGNGWSLRNFYLSLIHI